MAVVAQPIPDWIEDTLECPVCLKAIVDAPVYACDNIHHFCDVCYCELKKRGESCPVCRGNLTDKRIWSVEKILDRVFEKVKCKHEECNFQKADIARVEAHEEDCEHRPLPCYFCKEHFPLSMLAYHLIGRHERPLSDGYILNQTENWSCMPRHEFSSSEGKAIIFFTIVDGSHMSFFLNYIMIDSRYLMIWCSHNGSKFNKTNFQYTFTLKNGKSKAEGKTKAAMASTGFCLPMDVPLQSILDELPGVVIPRKQIVDNLCYEKKMHYSISFYKTPADD